MKVSSPTYVGWRSGLIVMVVLGCWFAPAYSQTSTSDISLFVQQTPDGGGATNPVSGVYRFAPNSEVILTATASPGFQFVYWLGDVSNPEAVSTVVHLDKPKIVIAVFEQAEPSFSGGGMSGGGGGLITTSSNLSAGGGLSSTTGAKPQTVSYSTGGDTTPEIPEPATGVLLTLGMVILMKKRRPNKIRFHRN